MTFFSPKQSALGLSRQGLGAGPGWVRLKLGEQMRFQIFNLAGTTVLCKLNMQHLRAMSSAFRTTN